MFNLFKKLSRAFWPKDCFIVRHGANMSKVIGVFYDPLDATSCFARNSTENGLKFSGEEIVDVINGKSGEYCFAYKNGRAELILMKQAIQ